MLLKPFSYLFRGSLIFRIIIGVLLALVLYFVFPWLSDKVSFLGQLFITLLRSIAPFLVFILILTSIARADAGSNQTIRSIVFLYIISSVIAAFLSAFITLAMPHVQLQLGSIDASAVKIAKESTAGEVLMTQFLRMFENPVSALVSSNFLALLTWSVAFGVAFRYVGDHSRMVMDDIAQATTQIVSWIVQLAPIGVFGIFSDVLVHNGVAEIIKYIKLIVVLMVCFAAITFIYFPVVGFIIRRRNPLPLLFKCLAISGIPAFFSRSSAANIPVNLEACNRFGISSKVAAFTIPLGANINLTAASATITVLSITAALSLGIHVDPTNAALTCVVAALCALGCSGIPGGSLLMIPIAASLFGIDPAIASKMIAIGFLIAVIQDSVETAINSAGDLYFTSLICERNGELEPDAPEHF